MQNYDFTIAGQKDPMMSNPANMGYAEPVAKVRNQKNPYIYLIRSIVFIIENPLKISYC